MAANPGAEAAIAPHCCSQAFASPSPQMVGVTFKPPFSALYK